MEKKFLGEFFIACCNTPKLLDTIEEALDQVTVFVQRVIILPWQ
jgi:hypothetical protein